MQNGYITVQTFLSAQSFGVAGATVTLSDGRVLTTDENGFTPTVAVDAPDKILSESPGNVQPFTFLDMTVEKEGYFTIVLRNVQVFSGEATNQPIQMLPLPEGQGAGTLEFDFTAQNL